MAELTNELMFETLKAIRHDIADVADRIGALEGEVRVVKGFVATLVQSDLNRDRDVAALTRRVERIERRLELID